MASLASKAITAVTSIFTPMRATGAGKLPAPIASGAFAARSLGGKEFNFAQLDGKVVLVTNVACACGYTSSNYEGLVKLVKDIPELHILAFPSNEFGKQESGSPEEILAFVAEKGVPLDDESRFHMMEKIETNGPNQHPIYATLKKSTGTEDLDVTWNFETKFLIAKDGVSVERFSKAYTPSKLQDNILAAVKA